MNGTVNSSLHNTHKGWVFTCRLEGNLSWRCPSKSSGKRAKAEDIIDTCRLPCWPGEIERREQYIWTKTGYNHLPIDESAVRFKVWCKHPLYTLMLSLFNKFKDMLKSYRLRPGVISSYQDSNVENVFSQICEWKVIEQPNTVKK